MSSPLTPVSLGSTEQPTARRMLTQPVVYWAAVGVLLLAASGYALARWAAAGNAHLRVGGDYQLSPIRTVTIWAAQATIFIVCACLAAWVIRQCLRERRLTFDASLYIAFLLQALYGPVIDARVVAHYSTAAWYLPTWATYYPTSSLWAQPDAADKIQPVLVDGFAYGTGLFFGLIALYATNWVWRLRGKPITVTAGYLAALLVACIVADFLMEVGWISSGAYCYRKAIPALTLFPGHWYQIPLYHSAVIGIFWFGLPMVVRQIYHAKGPDATVVLKGIDQLPTRARPYVQTLALSGLANLCVLALTVGGWLLIAIPGGALPPELPPHFR